MKRLSNYLKIAVFLTHLFLRCEMILILSKIFFIVGLLLLIPHVILYFIMQVYIFNPYWIMIIGCLIFFVIIYENPKNKIRLRFLIYFIALSNILTIYGFGTFCHGDYNFNIIGQYFCVNLSALLGEDFNFNQLILYLLGIIGLFFIEIGNLIKTRYLKNGE